LQDVKKERTSLFPDHSLKDFFTWRHYAEINYSNTQITTFITTVVISSKKRFYCRVCLQLDVTSGKLGVFYEEKEQNFPMSALVVMVTAGSEPTHVRNQNVTCPMWKFPYTQ